MNVKSVTVTFSPASKFTLNSSYCEVSVNTAHLHLDVNYTGSGDSSAYVGSITGYRPFRQTGGTIQARFEGFTYITYDGKIYLYANSSITSATSYPLDFIYLLD